MTAVCLCCACAPRHKTVENLLCWWVQCGSCCLTVWLYLCVLHVHVIFTWPCRNNRGTSPEVRKASRVWGHWWGWFFWIVLIFLHTCMYSTVIIVLINYFQWVMTICMFSQCFCQVSSSEYSKLAQKERFVGVYVHCLYMCVSISFEDGIQGLAYM